jgi:hypothetical protein
VVIGCWNTNWTPDSLILCFAALVPLDQWTRAEVVAWLQDLQKEKSLMFNVEDVACDGDLFAAMIKDDMKEMAGGVVGIHIFNAKEKLAASLQASPIGTNPLSVR